MLQTQVAYWANQEAKRHNLAQEAIAKTDAQTKRFEAETNRANMETSRARMEIEAVNALTAQTEAATRREAQTTNEARRLQDYELALRDLLIKQQNADSTRTQAQAGAYLDYARGDQSKVETVYIPYSTGANIAGSVVSTISKASGPVKSAAKSVKSGIQSLLYTLRN